MKKRAKARPGRNPSAEDLLKVGDFVRAEDAFRARLSLNAIDADAWLNLSAIALRTGRNEEAKQLLRHAARTRPLEGGAKHKPGSLILRPRCIDAANYCAVRKKGIFKTKYKGGHFSLKDIFPGRKGNMMIANLIGGDPSPLYAAPRPDVFLNSIACADQSRASLRAVARYLDDNPSLPVINHPDAVAATTRDMNYRRLANIEGSVFPKTIRVPLDLPVGSIMDEIANVGISLPLIIRTTGQQTGRSLHFCTTTEEAKVALYTLGSIGEAYVIAYADVRRPDGLFHKARAFFINGEIYPVAWLTNDLWQIHSGDRYRVMAGRPESQIEEQRYLNDPETACGTTAWAALREVAKRMDLDFAGIDFSILPSGELFIFEANAAMRHNFDHASNFPYTRPYLEDVTRAFGRMVDERMAVAPARYSQAIA